jgi:hypothetical protein
MMTKKSHSIETDPEWTQVLELPDKDIKNSFYYTCIPYVQKVK